MTLQELCSYSQITIQCHDNPDADTIAAAFALNSYFLSKDVNTEMIYCGAAVSKPNIKMMLDKLDIPLRHIECDNYSVKGLLILVDCQYGEKNVSRVDADTLMIFDHHDSKSNIEQVEYADIQPQLGACSTLIWNYLRAEGFFEQKQKAVETALYYGLMTDTENFVEAHHPLDLDMRDELDYDKKIISQLCNNNITLDELEVAGMALLKNIYNGTYRYSVAQSKPCDPNVMGVIIDLIKTVDSIDTCVIFNDCGSGYRFSIRNCSENTRANELAEYIAQDIGSAGGHADKAGGYIDKDKFRGLGISLEFESYLNARIARYFDSVEIIKADEYQVDLSRCNKYRRMKKVMGYIDPREFAPNDSTVLIRTVKGDVNINVDEDLFIMIGVLGEIYTIPKSEFASKFIAVDCKYESDFEYNPIMRSNADGRKWELRQIARACVVSKQSVVYARRLEDYAKVFAAWYKDNYMYGKPGDYIVANEDDLHDIYIIRGELFEQIFEPV